MSFLDQLYGSPQPPMPNFSPQQPPRPPGEVGAVQPEEAQPRTVAGYRQAGTQPLAAYLSSGKGPESANNLTPAFQQRLSAMLAAAPPQVSQNTEIFSGWRSNAHQAQLYANAVQKYGAAGAGRWVAPPGRSYHNKGEASDLNFKTPEARQWFHDNAEKFGMKFPMGHEPWHIEVAETRGGQKFAGQLPGGDDHPVDTPAPVQTAAVPLPTARPAAADAAQPTQEQAFSPTQVTEQKAPALMTKTAYTGSPDIAQSPAQQAIKGAMANPSGAIPPSATAGASTGDVAAAAASINPLAPAAAPGARPQVASTAPAQTPPPAPKPAAPPRITIPAATFAPSLGDRIITAMGPRGAGMSTYIDPSTQHQILNPGGSGEGAMGLTRDLGPLSRQTPARAAPVPQRPAAGQPPGAPTAAPQAAPAPPQSNFVGVRTPRSDFSGPVAPTPFAGSMDPLTGAPNLSGPTPPAPDAAGALAPQPPPPAPAQGPNMGGSLSPFTIGGINLFPPAPPAPPQQQQPPPQWPPQAPPYPMFGGQGQSSLPLAPFTPDWQSYNMLSPSPYSFGADG
jgi:hypothetical protein